MKKNIVQSFFLILLILFFVLNGQSQYPYIRIADVQVTSTNQDNITSSYISGTIRYNPDSHTLTFQNATVLPWTSGDPMDYSGSWVVSIGGHSTVVNIELIGDNEISGLYPLVIYEGSYNIIGTGTLTLNSTYFEGINCDIDVPSFTITGGAHVNINVPSNSPHSGFAGSTGEYAHTIFEMDSSSLTINAAKCFKTIEGFQLRGCCVSSPEGAYYDHDSLTLVTESGVVKNHMEIRPGTVGVEEHSAKGRFAWGVLGGLYVKNESGTSQRVEVLNTLGQHVASDILQTDRTFIPMRAGAYIVRVGDRSVKVVVY
ncbi:MAG: hypothetical protein II865_06780 [Bacteroidales bacterium]|nr:hypothetical protein [Bacteroidales bacterium]